MFRRKAGEDRIKRQEDSLRDWDKKLKESQNRILDLQRSLNDREERANENDKLFKIKQEELEEAKKALEHTKATLKIKEDDINKRLAELHLQEKVIHISLNAFSFILISHYYKLIVELKYISCFYSIIGS